ncbi:hypothetical protein OK348_05780 [Flavobacterium sp. MXW15]|uniref:LicD family protein n=1 Tax=Xanthomonas chitinilytica TaxID=2989819 RepID=A0ABT3JSR4_9XANT|nr:hypothetical protein [Xanthomonas sp. H13-6]MCW4454300.1 hypothetical protein [Flavobacterium sp. MXW15]MCW4471532.1 hypothetical protein [Xanthomonas sp. H13-6]
MQLIAKLSRTMDRATDALRGVFRSDGRGLPRTPCSEQDVQAARMLQHSRAALSAGDFGTALGHLSPLLQQGGGDVSHALLLDAHLLKHDALFKQGRPEQARDALDQAEQIGGNDFRIALRRGTSCLYRGRYEQGLAILGTIDPDSPHAGNNDIVMLQAELLCRAGQSQAAASNLMAHFGGRAGNLALKEQEFIAIRRCITSEDQLREIGDWLVSACRHDPGQLSSALRHYSMAARDLELYEKALDAICRRLELASKLQPRPPQGKPASKQNWARLAGAALLDLRHDLDAQGIDIFLISGTLLGCIREGKILGHDKDIDVGVFETTDIDRLSEVLRSTGRFKELPVSKGRVLRFKHANGVMIDVFVHFREKDLIWHQGQKSTWWNSEFGLASTDFLGASFKIPSPADRYLLENYGDWRTPAPDFETFTDTPNMVASDPRELSWYYLKILPDYFQTGHEARFNRVCSALEGIIDMDKQTLEAIETMRSKLRSFGLARPH